MKFEAVPVNKLFTPDYLNELTIENKQFLGQSKCVIFNDTLYMPLNVADEIGYSVMSMWIEEIDV